MALLPNQSGRSSGFAIRLLCALYACSAATAVLGRSAANLPAPAAPLSSTSNSLAEPKPPAPVQSKPFRGGGAASTHLHLRAEPAEAAAADIGMAKAVADTTASLWSELEYVYSTYQQCSDVDLSVCLKLKLVGALNGAARSMRDIEPVEGVRFVSLVGQDGGDGGAEKMTAETAESVSDAELLATLPRSVEGQESALSAMIWDRVAAFFRTHTVQIDGLARQNEADNGDVASDDANDISANAAAVDPRGKGKKDHGAFVMIPLMLASIVVPMAYGALAALAGKALIVSKLALVLASIIGIKKLLSKGHSHDMSHDIKFPTAAELRSRAAEGRDKDKKHHGYIMIPLLLGSTIIPIAYGALALLAGKALIVSKLALVLASIIGIKKLVSHSSDTGGGSRRIGQLSAAGEQQAEWARKFELPASVLQQQRQQS